MEPLTVPGNLSSLSLIADYVMSAAKLAGLDKKSAYRLRLAIDEVATNIIVHGYEEAEISGNLDIHTTLDGKSLTLFVEDTGDPFDPTKAALPDNLDQPLENRTLGGLGVYLTLQGVDRFIYERIGDHNRNIFIMNLSIS
jgi:serine/threonine-protein kinase RsbW